MNLHVEMLTNVLLRFEDDEVLEVLEDLELEELELEELELEELELEELELEPEEPEPEELKPEPEELEPEELELEELELEELELEVAVLVVLVMILSNKDHTNVQLLQHALILLAHILANVMMDTLVMVKCALISMNV